MGVDYFHEPTLYTVGYTVHEGDGEGEGAGARGPFASGQTRTFRLR